MTELYRVRLKRPDLEVEVESTDRDYVETKLDQYLNNPTARAQAATETYDGSQRSHPRPRPTTIGEFVRQIGPTKKNEVAAAIAYFLEFHADPVATEWKPDQIADKFPDVRKPKPVNMTDLLVKSNFFMSGREKGSYRLSETGVTWVEAQTESHES